jgi:4-diphosphocytidyl-2-C-methyl-D-erythritol kinase
MNEMRLRTNAKVNLFLRVMGKRGDGYHELETVFHGIGLADEMVITPTLSGVVEVEMKMREDLSAGLPELQDNLAWAAANALIEKGAKNAGVHIAITKHIPIAAGLGGGSGNAAGVLVALNEIWGTSLDATSLVELAGGIGSDVPYCISGGTALATGRGETLTPLPFPAELWLVIGISSKPLYTSDVYEAWEPSESTGDVRSAPITLALGAGDVAEVATLLHNDLEPAIFRLRPELEAKKIALLEAGAMGALVAGSGPTVFGIASEERHAHSIAAGVKAEFDETLVVSTIEACIERVA